MNRFFISSVVALLSYFVASGNAANGATTGDLHSQPNIQKIIVEIRRCPAWTLCREDEIEFRAGITRLYFELSAFDTPTIRIAFKQLLSDPKLQFTDRFYTDAKLFALLRVLFDVPAGFIEGAKNCGNWGSPVLNGNVNLLWPYVLVEGGKLKLTGVSGHYYGPPYDALAEFDEFASRFERRRTNP